MNFSELVLEQLDSLFKSYGLQVVEQRHDYLKLQSAALTVIVAHNKLENSNIFWLGTIGKGDLVEIDNDVLKLYFKSNLKLSQVSVDVFVKNLRMFFTVEGKSLFEDIAEVHKLEDFDLKRNQIYTQNIIAQQNLASADIAWKESDYNLFIKILDKIDHNVLPSSYRLKHKIAQERK